MYGQGDGLTTARLRHFAPSSVRVDGPPAKAYHGPLPAADDPTRSVDIIEGPFWLGLAAVLLTVARRKTNRADKLTAAGVLAAFGVSDFVEARTGAWWDPPWLLAWKAACLAVLGVLAARHLRRIRRRREEPGPAVG